MELAGHKCVGFCEFDKFAYMSYVSMHLITDEQREYLSTLDIKQRQKEIMKDEYRNGEWYANDVRTVDARDIPRADCWCFGFPCQDISVAGKQLGFNGHRSSLFFAVTDLIDHVPEENRPHTLFIENVRNLLSVNKGFDFARLLVELEQGGYDAEWQVINSNAYVPQNRERVFIIGRSRTYSGPKVFPFEAPDGTNRVSIIGHRDGYKHNTQVFSEDGITGTLDTAAGGGRGHHVAIPVLTPDRAEKRQNGRRFKDDGEDAFTLTGQDRHGVAIGVDELKSINIENGSLLAPNNFQHKAGDGTKTRKRYKTDVSPALQAQPGSTQATYLEVKVNVDSDVRTVGIETQGTNVTVGAEEAHCLNANDQRKVFGTHQTKTMAANVIPPPIKGDS